MHAITLILLTVGASVRDFGAKGDGVADDTVVFQRAIAASVKVSVPPGTYRVGQLVIGAKAPGRWLCGSGRDVTILVDTGAGAELVDGSRPCVAVIDSPDVRISGLTIMGMGDGDKDSIGVAFHAAPRFVCDGVAVESVRGRGIWVHSDWSRNGSLRNVLVRNIRCRADGCYGIGCWVYGGGNFGAPQGCGISRLTVSDCDDAGLALDAGTSTGPGHAVKVGVNGLTLLNCATRSTGGAAVLTLSGAQGCTLSSVLIDWPTSVATGPAIVFARDQTGVACSGNRLSGLTINRAWRTPIAVDQSDGTSTITGATVQVRGDESVTTIRSGSY